MTSHISTTGANLQGFNAVTLNTIADFVTGADFGSLGVAKGLGTNIRTQVIKTQ